MAPDCAGLWRIFYTAAAAAAACVHAAAAWREGVVIR